MPTNHQLEAIRQACIAANPSGYWKEYGPGVGEDANGNLIAELRPREIRLADVLLAIDEKSKEEWSKTANPLEMLSNHQKGLWSNAKKLIHKWNLRSDTLESQSEETINFIYQLLEEPK